MERQRRDRAHEPREVEHERSVEIASVTGPVARERLGGRVAHVVPFTKSAATRAAGRRQWSWA